MNYNYRNERNKKINMNDTPSYNDKGNYVCRTQVIPSCAHSVVTLETTNSRSTFCHDDTFSTTVTKPNTTTSGGVTRSKIDKDSEKRWNKYYQKLKKYQHNWKKGYRRHPKLIPFIKREQQRYDFYTKYGHFKRIELLEALPEFKWDILPQKNQSTTIIKSNTLSSQTLLKCNSPSTSNNSIDQNENNVSSKQIKPSENHNATHCNVNQKVDEDYNKQQHEETTKIPMNKQNQTQSDKFCDEKHDQITTKTTNCTAFMDVISFCQRSEEKSNPSNKNDEIFDCLSKRLQNKAKQLETFYARNRSKKTRNISWFQSIVVPQKDTSPTAFVLFRWCNIIRGDIGIFFANERKNKLKQFGGKITHPKRESKAIIQLLVAIYDHLNPSETINNDHVLMQSWETKVLDIIGTYTLQRRPKRMPIFELNIKDLKNFYLKQVMQYKISHQGTFYSLLWNAEPSLQKTKLLNWCTKTRYAFNSCSIMKTSTNYKINAFVQLYDQLQNILEAQNSTECLRHELSQEDKVCSLIGEGCFLTTEEENLDVLDILNTTDLPIKPQSFITQRMMKEYDEMLKKIEEYYNDNSHAKVKSKSWYDTVLNEDTSLDAVSLKNWCSSQRSLLSDYFQKKEASGSSLNNTSIEKIINLYDRLECQVGGKESNPQNVRCQTKVYEIIGKPPHLKQTNHEPIDKDFFKNKFKTLIIYYIKLLRCKTKEETWFDGVLCRFKSDEVSQLRIWCSKQRNLLKLCNKGDPSYVYYKEAVAEIYDELDVYLKTNQRNDQKMTCDEKVYNLIGGELKKKETRSK